MENAPEPGPAKKPRSTTPRAAAARKPATARKPAPKTAAKPAVKSTAKPAAKSTAKPAPKRPATPRAKPAAATPKPEVVEVVEAEVINTAEDVVVEEVVDTTEVETEGAEAEVVEPEVVETDVVESDDSEPEDAETEPEVVDTPADVETPVDADEPETEPEVVEDISEQPGEVVESETVLEQPDSPFDPEAADEPAAHESAEPEPEAVEAEPSEPSRVTIGRFTLPKLTLPKLVVPTLGRARTVEPETPDAVEATEDVASDIGASDEAGDVDAVEETVLDEPTVEEAVEDAPLADEADDSDDADTSVEPETESEPDSESEVIEAVIVEESTVVARATPKKKNKKASTTDAVLRVEGLSKHFDETLAVDSIDLEVPVGAFYGIVGPNGAGKTTTLSMITGLLRPDSGRVLVHGADVWSDPATAKRNMGVLPDRLRLFDRLTGAQLLHYAGVLRGLDSATVTKRAGDLAAAFGLEDAMSRLVSDYSAGMTKKIALAAAMIHSPRLLVLDEPFESVDPVSAATVTEILTSYTAAGGTVVLSSHSMDLVQRICDNVAVIVHGRLLADGTMDEVRDGLTLEERFVSLVDSTSVEGMEWLHSFSD